MLQHPLLEAALFRYTKRFGVLFALSILLGCSTNPIVISNPGDDYWSQWVNEQWLPRTREALEDFNALIRKNDVPALKYPAQFQIASSKSSSQEVGFLSGDKNTRTLSIALEQNEATADLYHKSVVTPVAAQALLLSEQLADGHSDRSVAWLRVGSARLFGLMVMDEFHDPEVSSHDWQTLSIYYLRNLSTKIDPLRIVSATRLDEIRKIEGFQELSSWMTSQLQQTLGPRFIRAWAQYFQLLAKPDITEEEAFHKAFGMSDTEFMQHVDEELAALRAEKRQHIDTPPKASGYADITDTAKFPLASAEARSSYEAYLQARAPKAFAVSAPLRVWSFDADAADAMQKALTSCQLEDPVNCQLYAVDDQVVYHAPSIDTAHVDVIMVSKGEDEWTQSVKSEWMPVIQTTANAFNPAVRQYMNTGLLASARIYVASNREDYARTIRDNLHTLSAETEHHRVHSIGVADGHGQIAILLSSDLPSDQVLQTLTETMLHELVHELQSQLSYSYAGFSPPPWIVEGSADALAAKFASKLPGDVAKQFAPEERHTRLVHWYRLEATPFVDAVFTATEKEWAAMSAHAEFHYEMAELMTNFLETEVGDRFPDALREYFKRAGQTDQTPDTAFLASFGISRDEFLLRFKIWLKTL